MYLNVIFCHKFNNFIYSPYLRFTWIVKCALQLRRTYDAQQFYSHTFICNYYSEKDVYKKYSIKS